MPVFSKPSWVPWFGDGAADEPDEASYPASDLTQNIAEGATQDQFEDELDRVLDSVPSEADNSRVNSHQMDNPTSVACECKSVEQELDSAASEKNTEDSAQLAKDAYDERRNTILSEGGEIEREEVPVKQEDKDGDEETGDQYGDEDEEMGDQNDDNETVKQEPDSDEESELSNVSNAEQSDTSSSDPDDSSDAEFDSEDEDADFEEEEQQPLEGTKDSGTDAVDTEDEDKKPKSLLVRLKCSLPTSKEPMPMPAVKHEDLGDAEALGTKQLPEENRHQDVPMTYAGFDDKQHNDLFEGFPHQVSDFGPEMPAPSIKGPEEAQQHADASPLLPSAASNAGPRIKTESGLQEQHNPELQPGSSIHSSQPASANESIVHDPQDRESDPSDIMTYYTRYSPDDHDAQAQSAPRQAEEKTEIIHQPLAMHPSEIINKQCSPDKRATQKQQTPLQVKGDFQTGYQGRPAHSKPSYQQPVPRESSPGNTRELRDHLGVPRLESIHPPGSTRTPTLGDTDPRQFTRACHPSQLQNHRLNGDHWLQNMPGQYYSEPVSAPFPEPAYDPFDHGMFSTPPMRSMTPRLSSNGQQRYPEFPYNSMYPFPYFNNQTHMPVPNPYQQNISFQHGYHIPNQHPQAPQEPHGGPKSNVAGDRAYDMTTQDAKRRVAGQQVLRQRPAGSQPLSQALGKRKAKYVIADEEDEERLPDDGEQSSDDDEPLATRIQRHPSISNPTDSVVDQRSPSDPQVQSQGRQEDEEGQYVGMHPRVASSSILPKTKAKPHPVLKSARTGHTLPKPPSLPRPLPVPQVQHIANQSSSNDISAISFKLPVYNIELQPLDDETGLPNVKVSLPNLVREQLFLSPDHAARETHLLTQLFLPGQQALAEPDPRPELAALNFHSICVMVLDEFTQFEIGDLVSSAERKKVKRDHDFHQHDESDEEEPVRHQDAKDADVDEIFFAVIDRWRVGMARNEKKNYSLIRGVQEFCDIALDIIYYIKEHGLPCKTRQRRERSDKGVKRGPRGEKKTDGKGKEVASTKKSSAAVAKKGPGRPPKEASGKKTGGKGEVTVLQARKKQKTGTNGKGKDKVGSVTVTRAGGKRK